MIRLLENTRDHWGILLSCSFERIIWVNLANNQESLWVSFMNLGGMADIEKKHELAKSWDCTQKFMFDLFGSVFIPVLSNSSCAY